MVSCLILLLGDNGYSKVCKFPAFHGKVVPPYSSFAPSLATTFLLVDQEVTLISFEDVHQLVTTQWVPNRWPWN